MELNLIFRKFLLRLNLVRRKDSCNDGLKIFKKGKSVSFIILFILFLAIFFYILLFNKRRIKIPKIKHVYLITIDTLRADHLSCYGYPVKTTPFIDSLAKDGILFKNAFSQSATTCPSHASIMTGLYPSEHRVLANGYILEDSYTTLAEILKKDGFKTFAFTSTDRHFLASHINQGFEFYDEPPDTVKTYGYKYRPARLTINKAIMHLDGSIHPDDKLFVWIHLFDPHLPYYPPKKYRNYVKKQLNKTFLRDFIERAKVNLEIFNNSFDNFYEHILGYDSEIRYVDDELKRFFKIMKKRGFFKDSLIIITADHGEGLGQHNWLQHAKQIYQEEIHVPLIFYFSDTKIKGKVFSEYVENFDIFSTVLDFLNIKLDKKLGKSISSVSLKDLIFFNKKVKKPVFVERQFYKERDGVEKAPLWKVEYEKGVRVALIKDGFKYIYASEYPDEFYNLEQDGFELNNILSQKEKYSFKFKKLIMRKLSRFKNKKIRKVSEKIFRKLRGLGYVE